MPSAIAREGSTAPLMAGGQPISEAVADQAAAWLTLLMSGEATDDDRQRLQQWRGQQADHERAWQHVEAVTKRLGLLAPRAGYQALSPYAGPKSPARRKAAHVLAWVGLAGTAGLFASRTRLWQQQVADHRTGAGEQHTVTLDDGTRVMLNTASAMDVRFDAQRRLLQLVAGEVLIVTGHGSELVDPRPFIVATAEGHIRALGTRFSVRQWDGHTSVAVQQSAVEIAPAADAARRILQAGERASFTRTAVGVPEALRGDDEAWTRGQIVAENMPLGEFLAELGRYRPGLVRCDPAVAGLRLSGVFPVGDTDRILATLPSVLPVRVWLRTRYWVTVDAAT